MAQADNKLENNKRTKTCSMGESGKIAQTQKPLTCL